MVSIETILEIDERIALLQAEIDALNRQKQAKMIQGLPPELWDAIADKVRLIFVLHDFRNDKPLIRIAKSFDEFVLRIRKEPAMEGFEIKNETPFQWRVVIPRFQFIEVQYQLPTAPLYSLGGDNPILTYVDLVQLGEQAHE